MPGFGYPPCADMDVRAHALLASIEVPPVMREPWEVVSADTGLAPNIDSATVALSLTHDLPSDAPIVLFAAARVAGWLAHAVEQAT